MISSDLLTAVGTTGSNRSESEGGDRQKPADSVEKVAASPCRWQNCSVSGRGGEQHDGTATEWTAAPVLLVQSGRPYPSPTPPAQYRPVSGMRDLLSYLADFYSSIGRSSIDPKLMMRMLVIGYCYVGDR